MALFGRDHVAALYEATAAIFEVAVETELKVQRENNDLLAKEERKPIEIDYMGLISGIRARLLLPEVPASGPLEMLAEAFLEEFLSRSEEEAEEEEAGE